MKTLKSVEKFISKIPYINAGGCGIAALAMYRWIENNKPKLLDKTEILFIYKDDEKDYKINCKLLKTKKTVLKVPCHVVIKANNKIYNSMHWRTYQKHKVTLEHLINTINNTNNWNDTFYRNPNTSIISKKLNVNLTDVKLN
jgi:ribosomal protein L39E